MQASVRVFYCNHPWMLQIKTINLSFEIRIIDLLKSERSWILWQFKAKLGSMEFIKMFDIKYFCIFVSKGKLILKASCQAEDSSKNRTNEFVFTGMRHVFVRFFWRILGQKKTFRDYLTFILLTRSRKKIENCKPQLLFSQNCFVAQKIWFTLLSIIFSPSFVLKITLIISNQKHSNRNRENSGFVLVAESLRYIKSNCVSTYISNCCISTFDK